MKRIALFAFAFVALFSFADPITARVEVVTVDQHGQLNSTGVVATVSALAAAAAQAEIADAKAQAAADAAKASTNAIQAVADAIVSNELVVYAQGSMSSFSSMVLFSPNAKMFICDFKPNVDTASQTPLIGHDLTYALNEDPYSSIPTVLNSYDLRTNFEAVDPSLVDLGTRQPGSVTSEQGEVFDYVYKLRVYLPGDSPYFFKINVEPDAPSGDGATLDIRNGITGGVTTNAVWGDKLLTFTGGLLTGVGEATP